MTAANASASAPLAAHRRHRPAARPRSADRAARLRPAARLPRLAAGAARRHRPSPTASRCPVCCSSGPTLTTGAVSALAGLRDNPLHFQISAPVQPGNSGGRCSMRRRTRSAWWCRSRRRPDRPDDRRRHPAERQLRHQGHRGAGLPRRRGRAAQAAAEHWPRAAPAAIGATAHRDCLACMSADLRASGRPVRARLAASLRSSSSAGAVRPAPVASRRGRSMPTVWPARWSARPGSGSPGTCRAPRRRSTPPAARASPFRTAPAASASFGRIVGDCGSRTCPPPAGRRRRRRGPALLVASRPRCHRHRPRRLGEPGPAMCARAARRLPSRSRKTFFLTNARTLRRKVQESLLTLLAGQQFSKSEILEIWLNRVHLVPAPGASTRGSAVFGVSARHCQLWQAAVLAGLPPRPPGSIRARDPAAATARAGEVLAAMVAAGAIRPSRRRRDPGEPDCLLGQAPAGGGCSPTGPPAQARMLPPGADVVLRTTLDSRLQSTVDARLRRCSTGPGVRLGATQAVAVLDASTGAVRAMVGGALCRCAYNRAAGRRRQPGSAFKPSSG